MQCKKCKSNMQITDSKLVSEIDSTDIYSEQTLECVNPNCKSKGTKVKVKNKVN